MSSKPQFTIDGSSHNGNSFLDVNDFDEKCPYPGKRQLLRLLDTRIKEGRRRGLRHKDEWVLCTNIDEKAFTCDFFDVDEQDMARLVWNSYDETQHLLLARMPVATVHEFTAFRLETMLILAVDCMGLFSNFTNYMTFHHGAGSAKGPIRTYGPSILPGPDATTTPPVVVESDVSESPAKLMSDVRYWMQQPKAVMLITLHINPRVPQVILDKWERGDGDGDGDDSGTTATGEHNRPQRKQHIVMREGRTE